MDCGGGGTNITKQLQYFLIVSARGEEEVETKRALLESLLRQLARDDDRSSEKE